MKKSLAILLLLLLAVGCGKKNDSAENPVKDLTIEGLAGTYERVDSDGMRFILVIDDSGTFRDSFELFGSVTEQASGKCKVLDKEVHFHYQTPADLAEIVDIFKVLSDGSLSHIARLLDEERHELSKEQQAEILDWMKKS
jgi:hypothetical protein